MKLSLTIFLSIIFFNNIGLASAQSSDNGEEEVVTCDLHKLKYLNDDEFHKRPKKELVSSVTFNRFGENRISPSIEWFDTKIDIGGMKTKGFNIAMFVVGGESFLDTFTIKVSSEKGCEANSLACMGERPVLISSDLSKVGSKMNLRVFDYQVECRNVMTSQMAK